MQLDPEIAKGITQCISIGPGNLTDFAVNGKIIKKKFEWKQYCVIDPNYGGFIADNKLIHSFKPSDSWSCKTMKNNIVVNGISLPEEELERLKKKNKSETNLFL